MTSNQQIKLGAVLSYISIAVNIITGLVYTPWMISSIGQENYGLYTLAMSVITLFVFDFGLSVSINRFLSKYISEGNQEKANNCLGMVYRLYFFIDVILFLGLLVFFLFIPAIYKELTPDEIEKFKVVYAMASLYAVLSFPFIPLNGVLSAYEKFVQNKIGDIAHKIFIVLSMSLCLLLGFGLYALVFVNAIAGILLIAYKLFCIKIFTPQKANANYFDKQEFKQVLGFSGWVTVMSLCQRCIFTIAPTILGALSGSVAIAIFGIANTLEGYVFTFSTALSGMFLPTISRIVAKDGEVLPLMIKIGRIQLLIVSLVVIGFCVVGQDFILSWVGADFNESYWCTMLIILPSLLQLPQEIGDQTLYARNKIKGRAIAFIAMAIINVILAIPLTKLYGALGICIAISIAYFVRTFILNIIYKRVLHIDLRKFFQDTFAPFFIPFLLICVLGYLIVMFIPIHGWVGLVIKGGLYVLLYAAIAYTMVMNDSEKQLVKSIIVSLINKIK